MLRRVFGLSNYINTSITPVSISNKPINSKNEILSLLIDQDIGIENKGLAVNINDVKAAPACCAASEYKKIPKLVPISEATSNKIITFPLRGLLYVESGESGFCRFT